MSKKEVDFSALKKYLPIGSYEPVLHFLHAYRVHLTVTRRRRTLLGDYRQARDGKAHRISVNGDLNRYAFLITLLHEIAHLTSFEKFGRRIMPHGKEWKSEFGNILKKFIGKDLFPTDVETAIRKSLVNPAASSCADEDLLRVLKKYDPRKAGLLFVESLEEGEKFSTADGRVFIRGEKMRKRYKCKEPATNRWFLFSPVYEVQRAG